MEEPHVARKRLDKLNLRMSARVDEVRDKVVQFLDRAYRPGHFRVFIIHGKGQGGDGTGPVRRETLRLLRDDAGVRQYVDSFWVAPPDRGGAGAAQVNLRH